MPHQVDIAAGSIGRRGNLARENGRGPRSDQQSNDRCSQMSLIAPPRAPPKKSRQARCARIDSARRNAQDSLPGRHG
jgi:hypothetical protein